MLTTCDPRRLRRLILDCSWRASAGHIGSALSVADILSAVYGELLAGAHPADPDRDVFVMSKGHAALAQYAAQFLRGWMSRETLDTYGRDGTLLGTHPDDALPGVEFSSGSLGQGLSFAAGIALGYRLRRRPQRVFALVSDAECNAGAIWEAAAFAAHHRLSNLIVFVDANGQQALGRTSDIMHPSPLADRWRGFGWEVVEADGHDVAGLVGIVSQFETAPGSGAPHVVIAETIFGKGVSFMERQLDWHYVHMSEDDYRRAAAEVGGDA